MEVSSFIEETITDCQRFNSGYKPFSINSSAWTSTVPSHATRADTGVFHGERPMVKVKLDW